MKTPKTRSLQVRLTPAQYEKLEQYAHAHEVSMSKVICKYIDRLPWKGQPADDDG